MQYVAEMRDATDRCSLRGRARGAAVATCAVSVKDSSARQLRHHRDSPASSKNAAIHRISTRTFGAIV